MLYIRYAEDFFFDLANNNNNTNNTKHTLGLMKMDEFLKEKEVKEIFSNVVKCMVKKIMNSHSVKVSVFFFQLSFFCLP